MATTQFNKGDLFKSESKKGCGIVLPDGACIMITGEGGRKGFSREKCLIPEDAVPGKSDKFEVSFALETVLFFLIDSYLL